MYKVLRTLVFSSINTICKIFLEVFIFDKQIRRILKGKLAKHYMKRYIKLANKLYIPHENNKEIDSKIIWQYCEQGADNLPKIVEQCIKSV